MYQIYSTFKSLLDTMLPDDLKFPVLDHHGQQC